jgi:hypothetical protein
MELVEFKNISNENNPINRLTNQDKNLKAIESIIIS